MQILNLFLHIIKKVTCWCYDVVLEDTTATKHSNFKSLLIWFVTIMRQEHTLCITLGLIWRKQQVRGKIAFYFRPKLAVCSKPSQMCVILKRCSCLVKHVLLTRIQHDTDVQSICHELQLWNFRHIRGPTFYNWLDIFLRSLLQFKFSLLWQSHKSHILAVGISSFGQFISCFWCWCHWWIFYKDFTRIPYILPISPNHVIFNTI